MSRTTGRYEITIAGGESVRAFMPDPLPPKDPPLDLARLDARLRAAEQGVARLEVAGAMVPSLDWFIYAFVRKEAVISSQIEGTQATLVDLLNYEAAETGDGAAGPTADVEEVCNYVDALAFARAQLANPASPPLSMRLLNGTHERLMRGVRGATKLPGEVRRSQNWIGGSRPGNASFVPPPPLLLPEGLSALEHYIHAEDPLIMLTAPTETARKALRKAGMETGDIDLWEINEAFAVVAEKFIRDLRLDRDKVNVNGGAMALGHPIGATGSMLIGTMIDELERRDLKRGLVTMCAAGGMAPAIIIERL